MANNNTQSDNGKQKNIFTGTLRGMLGISFVVVIFLIVMIVCSNNLRMKNAEYQQQIDNLNTEVEKEVQRAAEIGDLKDYMSSKEYIEQAAREKLGLVYPDEIVFRAE